MKKYIYSWLAAFLVIFNLGYVFHEIAAHDFFAQHISAITREVYIVPLVALAFTLYVAIMVYLFTLFYNAYKDRHSATAIGLRYGALIGFLWDGLQGGIIEVATFKMPFIVFVVDSSYHVCEGALTGLIISAVYVRCLKKEAAG